MRYLRAMAMAVAVLAAVPVRAQQQPPPKPPDEFVPVDAPMNAQDTIPAPLLFGAAYAVIWIAMFGYVWSIRRRLASVEREMTAIDRRLASGRK
jgi:CcmD family protein